jgi:hypothetical protein
MMNPDYERFYTLYKKMPGILAYTTIIMTVIWSIVDVSIFQTSYGSYFNRYTCYGIMELESALLAMLVWWAIGAVLAGIAWFFSALSVSATVRRTDAVVAIKEKLQQN